MNIGFLKVKNMINYLFFIVFLFITPSIYATPSANNSPELHKHQNIVETARQFLDDNIDKSNYSRTEIQMGQLDPRLRLSQCPLPLTATLAPGSRFTGKATVHIRCNSTSPWTVYVSAKIRLYGKVVQTANPLSRGHVLKSADLMTVEEDLSRIQFGYFVDKKSLIGKQLKRNLPQNKIIRANYVKYKTLVKRGELVSIIAGNSQYSVKMTGTAMGSGALGDRIRVKNTSSKRVVEGTIKEAGVVSIN